MPYMPKGGYPVALFIGGEWSLNIVNAGPEMIPIPWPFEGGYTPTSKDFERLGFQVGG